jgi:hypothetical protein
MLLFASWCVGEGGEILGKKYDASVVGGLLIAWLNTGMQEREYEIEVILNSPFSTRSHILYHSAC